MESDDNVYMVEQKGLLALDKYLLAFCIGVIPGLLGILANKPALNEKGQYAAIALVCVDIPAIFCLSWHSFRWPVRLKVMQDNTVTATTAFSKDLIHYVENVTGPKMKTAMEALPQIEGKDGKMYVIKKDGQKAILDALETTFGSNNPIVNNIVEAHAAKIYKAQREAVTGKLREKFALSKQIADQFSRYGRYWLMIAVAVSSAAFCISFFLK